MLSLAFIQVKVKESDSAAGMSNHHNINRSNLLFFINYQYVYEKESWREDLISTLDSH